MAIASGKVTPRPQPLSWLEPAIFTGSMLPLLWLGLRLARDDLGANPVAAALNQLGLLALLLLWACLACTPLKIVFGWNWPIRVRKTLGLLAFFTALGHFLFYFAVDQGFALGKVLTDVGKRPFIAVGFLALVLLVPLAVTSTKKALQRLGFKTRKRLHRLIYVVALLASLHFLLRVKTHDGPPLVYGAVLGLFFAVRLFDALRRRRKPAARA
jgi:methionine sulfoxide reductase heme-binding subunit